MCETYSDQEEKKKKYSWPLKMLLRFAYFHFCVYLFGAVFHRRYGTCIDRRVEADKDQ